MVRASPMPLLAARADHLVYTHLADSVSTPAGGCGHQAPATGGSHALVGLQMVQVLSVAAILAALSKDAPNAKGLSCCRHKSPFSSTR